MTRTSVLTGCITPEKTSGEAQKTPNDLVIKHGLKSLVETAVGKRLFWKQIKRAGHVLEKLTKGAVQFTNTCQHGWTLVASLRSSSSSRRASSAPGG